MVNKLCAGVAVAIMASAALAALAAQAAAPDLPLQQIVDRNISARGGLAAWRNVKTLSMSGQMDVGTRLPDVAKMAEDPHHPSAPRKRLRPDTAAKDVEPPVPITLPFLMEFKRPRKTRVELKYKDTTSVQVYDGAHGWKLRPYLARKQAQDYTPAELKVAAEQQDLDGPLVDYAAKGTRLEKAGIDTVDGREAYKLKLTLKNGDVRNLWIDAQTFLDLKIDGSSTRGQKSQRVETVMSDYRAVQGLQMPFHLENRVEGVRMPQRILIEQVSVNAPLADTLFAKPL